METFDKVGITWMVIFVNLLMATLIMARIDYQFERIEQQLKVCNEK